MEGMHNNRHLLGPNQRGVGGCGAKIGFLGVGGSWLVCYWRFHDICRHDPIYLHKNLSHCGVVSQPEKFAPGFVPDIFLGKLLAFKAQ